MFRARTIIALRGNRAGPVIAGLLATAFTSVSADPSKIDFSTYRPNAPATRISESEAPKIDGDVSDAVWQKAPAIDNFYQVEPKTGEPASERTIVRVLYDKNAIYVSWYCFDSDPKHIPTGAKARDTNVENGDIVRIYLDPGLTRRDAYDFEVNPRGGRFDALIRNNSDFIIDWNPIWAAKAKHVADGWTVEMMIPFRSISYDAKRADWGFDLYRRINRKQERVRWTSAIASVDVGDISREGTLTGMRDITQGIGLDIQTYASVRAKHEWVTPSETDIKLAESANLYYKLTPSLTASLTANPDFSNTPLDQRKINTTRFALFYPETRDFFLQDAAAFEFGGFPFANNYNGLPFFSRSVGLVSGVPVPIRIGAKLSGNVGGFGVGGFSAMADDLGDTGHQVLSVARVTHRVFDESKMGFIFTNGDPTGNSRNSVAGGDLQYSNTHVFGGNRLNATFSYLKSFSNKHSDDDEYAFGLQYPNEPWGGRIEYRETGGDFDPALGFVNRPGVRAYHFNAQHRSRPEHSAFRFIEAGMFQNVTTDIGNHMQSYDGGGWIGAQLNSGDQGWLNYDHYIEVVPSSFSFGGAATVPAGTHRWDSFDFNFQTSFRRPWTINADINCCAFYNGQAVQLYFGLTYELNETWEIIPQYSAAFIDLPSGSVSIHVGILDVNLNFSPDMQIKTEAQYDNMSRNFSFSARYRWEYVPGSEFFVAAGEEALITDRLWHSHYASQTTQASIRIGHTFRF